MKKTKMTATLVLVLGLMVLPTSVASGAQSLTVNGQPLDSITLELGQSCTVEVVSDDSRSYTDYVGFDNGLVLGDFSHLETTRDAGDLAEVTEYNRLDFYGYYVVADGSLFGGPGPGIHFVFEYEAQEVGETDVKLYQNTPPPLAGPLLDSVHITVIPAPMGTAITYQGRLNDAGSPADGLYDFEFKLYRSPNGGIQEGSTVVIDDLDVIDGHFIVELDFGSDVFNGDARWLETTVAQSDGSDPCTLRPRVELTPTPYAIYAQEAVYAQTAGNIPGGISGSGIANYIAKFTGPRTIGDSRICESGSYIGIGTSQPDCPLHVNLGYGYVKCGGPLRGDIFKGHFDGGGEGAAVRATLGGPPWSTAAYLAYNGASNTFAGYFQGNTKITADLTVDGRYYDSSGTAGINGQFLSSTGTGTSWAEVDWSDLTNVPVGFADGIDDVGGGDTDWIESSGNVYRATGNVGIRTSQPDCPLHVNLGYGYVKCGGPLRGDILEGHFDGGGEGAAVRATLGGPPSSDAAYLAYSDGTRYFAGYFEGDVYASGNVGIGTMDPEAGLHLKGTGFSSSFMYLESDSGQDTGFRLHEGDTVKWHIFNNSSVDALEIRNKDYSPVLIAEQSTGNVRVQVLEITGGSDLSEQFEVSGEGGKVKPGMVVCIDADNPGDLVVSKESYDRTVAGIVSGAGEVKPGMLMGQKGTKADGEHPVALTGRVYCWADASNGPIESGDLLTTSDMAGHAMKVTDYNKAQGAILGKAMTPLAEGRGLVLVLVTLQ